MLLLTLLPHAIPELVSLFLPLAAWIVASRRDDWQDLLAATAVTVAVAVPVLLAGGGGRDLGVAASAERGLHAASRRCWAADPGTQTGRPEGRPVWKLTVAGTSAH